MGQKGPEESKAWVSMGQKGPEESKAWVSMGQKCNVVHVDYIMEEKYSTRLSVSTSVPYLQHT